MTKCCFKHMDWGCQKCDQQRNGGAVSNQGQKQTIVTGNNATTSAAALSALSNSVTPATNNNVNTTLAPFNFTAPYTAPAVIDLTSSAPSGSASANSNSNSAAVPPATNGSSSSYNNNNGSSSSTVPSNAPPVFGFPNYQLPVASASAAVAPSNYNYNYSNYAPNYAQSAPGNSGNAYYANYAPMYPTLNTTVPSASAYLNYVSTYNVPSTAPNNNSNYGNGVGAPVTKFKSSFWNTNNSATSNGQTLSYTSNPAAQSSIGTLQNSSVGNSAPYNYPTGASTNGNVSSSATVTQASVPPPQTMPSATLNVNGVIIPPGTFNLFPANTARGITNGYTAPPVAVIPPLIPATTAITTRSRGRARGGSAATRGAGRGRGRGRATTKRPTLFSLDDLNGTKKLREHIIDDVVAVEIFRELGMGDTFLNSGKVLAWALQPDDDVFINIHDYVARSQEHGFGVQVLSVLRIIPKAADLQWLDFNEDPNAQGMFRMMLWHGTKRHCIAPILENGLKIPTMHGQMFGSGIYFADRVSKSCQYTDRTYSRGTMGVGYLFLCDVLLGEMYKSNTALPNTQNAPVTYGWGGQAVTQYNSVKGCGMNVPDIEWQEEIDGTVWPLGPTVRNNEDAGQLSLNYNEYIVYNTDQVQPKYLVKVKFTNAPVYENLY